MRKPRSRIGRITPRPPPLPRPRVDITISATNVAGQFPNQPDVQTVALLIDGRLQSTAAVDANASFDLMLPPTAFGSWLDVIDTASGHSVLSAALDYSAMRTIDWHNLILVGRQIEGRFIVRGQAAPPDDTAVLVDLLDDGRIYARAMAKALPGSARHEREFSFNAPLTGLPDPHTALRLAIAVSGTPPSAIMEINAADVGLLGCVDISTGPYVQGWVADLANPAQSVDVEILVDGVLIAVESAILDRPDIQAAGWGAGKSGFRINFPATVPLHRDVSVEVVIAGTRLNLRNSPYVHKASAQFVGCFDTVEGPFAGGWLIDMHDLQSAPVVEAVCEGEVIGSGTADLYRGDVVSAGFPRARCGFRFALTRPLREISGRDIYVRVQGTDRYVAGSPQLVTLNDNLARFLMPDRGLGPATLRRLARYQTHATRAARISIIMPVYNTPKDWLIEALNSVLGQWSANWELICIDDGSTEPHVRAVLDAYARHDARIRPLLSPSNVGIARAVNFGLRAARGDYVAFMDHDDVIEPDAIYRLAKAAIDTDGDLVYSDEALTTSDSGTIIEVRARPAFSHDYYLSHPYFVHMVCVRTDIARQLAGWDESLPISADVDFILRAIEVSKVITHVPGVLYRWRTHETSTGHAKQAQVNEVMKGVLTRHLGRLGLPATVSDGLRYNEYRIDWPDDGGEILIIIPTKNRVDLLRTCIDSIEKTSRGENYRIVVIDHQSNDPKTVRYLAQIAERHTVMPYSGVFNYALMNNLAVRTHGADSKYVLLLNNDVEAIQTGWLARLRSLAGRPDVGAVGPLLLYGDNRVQHAGVLMAFSGAADHAMKFIDAYLRKGERHPGYNCNLTSVRDYSAVTAACIMMRSDVFRQVGGFDEQFVVGFNDTDLCLRIGEAGFKILYDGQTVLYHHESATRTQSKEVDHPEDDARLRQRWAGYFVKGDPFYNPLLAARGTDHTLRADAGCKGRLQPRAMRTDRAAGQDTAPLELGAVLTERPVEKRKRHPKQLTAALT